MSGWKRMHGLHIRRLRECRPAQIELAGPADLERGGREGRVMGDPRESRRDGLGGTRACAGSSG